MPAPLLPLALHCVLFSWISFLQDLGLAYQISSLSCSFRGFNTFIFKCFSFCNIVVVRLWICSCNVVICLLLLLSYVYCVGPVAISPHISASSPATETPLEMGVKINRMGCGIRCYTMSSYSISVNNYKFSIYFYSGWAGIKSPPAVSLSLLTRLVQHHTCSRCHMSCNFFFCFLPYKDI